MTTNQGDIVLVVWRNTEGVENQKRRFDIDSYELDRKGRNDDIVCKKINSSEGVDTNAVSFTWNMNNLGPDIEPRGNAARNKKELRSSVQKYLIYIDDPITSKPFYLQHFRTRNAKY